MVKRYKVVRYSRMLHKSMFKSFENLVDAQYESEMNGGKIFKAT